MFKDVVLGAKILGYGILVDTFWPLAIVVPLFCGVLIVRLLKRCVRPFTNRVGSQKNNPQRQRQSDPEENRVDVHIGSDKSEQQETVGAERTTN